MASYLMWLAHEKYGQHSKWGQERQRQGMSIKERKIVLGFVPRIDYSG
jgi:hypothetical protein